MGCAAAGANGPCPGGKGRGGRLIVGLGMGQGPCRGMKIEEGAKPEEKNDRAE